MAAARTSSRLAAGGRPRFLAIAVSAVMYSFYYRSRLDIGLGTAGRFHCEDLRTGCSGMVSIDGRPPGYSYLAVDTTPDGR
jgi:hypothetical protein